MTKTVSTRIENKHHKNLLERCNQLGCNINEFLGESLKFALYDETEFEFKKKDKDEDYDQEPSEKEPDSITRKRPTITITNVPDEKPKPQLEVIRL